ncbi:hypothetical protein TMEN_7124 [Trichophyton mentagrophytes]|nr:hypothetical protein TMEN_7124 [Trichophyton mentagrophytes]
MAHLYHQSSLEGIINFHPQPLSESQRERAATIFHMIVDHFRQEELASDSPPRYSRFLLVHHSYSFSLPGLSQDVFLRVFFDAMGIDIETAPAPDFANQANDLRKDLTAFADFLFDSFFLPMRASGSCTSQPSPAHMSALQRILESHEHIPTPERVAALRQLCLIRDRHKCVISHTFDAKATSDRLRQYGDSAEDDDGNRLSEAGPDRQPINIGHLEVSHILPHSLTQVDASGKLNDAKKAALMILDMFDFNISHVIDGVDIDRPFNAITLTRDLHAYFGEFNIYFTPIPGKNHTYRIESTFPDGWIRGVPVTRELYITEDRSIDPPLPRLLALHRTIALIINLSGAAEPINKILRDMEDLAVSASGTTELGQLVTLKMNGWFYIPVIPKPVWI